jgi:tRNA-specific 2-thiouridylase
MNDDDRDRAAAFAPPRAEAPETIVVAMSGGVDSAVTAWLLREMGHDVIGVSLRLAPEADGPVLDNRCCSVTDLSDARRVCDAIGAPFYAIDARDRFAAAVVQPFVEAYQAGITPIPCLACNHVVKFGDLYEKAVDLGARLATGHYARVVERGGVKTLGRPLDRDRDQTYYLYGTARDVVQDLVLPLGDIDKPLARALAERAGLPVAHKPDSQEICFVPDGDHARVVEKLGGAVPAGAVVHVDGRTLRAHDGIHRFTVGQRRGVGVGGGERLYVIDVDPEGEVVVGPRDALGCSQILVHAPNAIVPMEAWPDEVRVQVRARHPAQPATWRRTDAGLEITFRAPVEGVALGQAAAIYDDDALLGGGLIASRLDGARPRAAPARALRVLAANEPSADAT